MLGNKRLLMLTVVGVVAVGAAGWTRHRIVASPTYQLARAKADPRFKNLDRQVGALQAAVKAAPRDAKARWALADMYQRLGLLDLAAEQIQAIVDMSPDDPRAAIALANTNLALVRPEAAKAQFIRITTRWPKEPEGWQGMSVEAYHERQFEKAVRYIRRAIQLRPDDPNYRYILGNSLQAYAEQFPMPETYAPILVLAREEFERILPQWPDPADVHVRLGAICSTLSDAKASAAHYGEALKLLPNRPDIATELALSYMGMARLDLALATVNSVIGHGPDYAPLYDLRGQLLQKRANVSDLAVIVASFQKAASLAPENAAYHEHLGTALVRAGKYPEARVALERAVALNPERAAPYQQLAAVYTRLREPKLAAKAAEVAAKMVFNEQQLRQIEELSASEPTDMNLHLILADRYRDLKMYTSAAAKYRLVLKHQPNNKRALDGLEALNLLRTRTTRSASR